MDLTNLNKDKRNRRKPSIDVSTLVYGKVPPQAKELEEVVLGAVMIERAAFDLVVDILQPECFYVDSHQRIFKTFISLALKNTPIDILTTVEELKAKEELDIVGGPYAITKLTNMVVSTANIEAHARIVFQKFLQRELIRIGGEMVNDGYEDSTDVFDLMDIAEGKISSLAVRKSTKPYCSIKDVLPKALITINESKDNPEKLTGVPSGIRRLDLITRGWQPGNLIIIAARPAVGKSAVAANFAMNAALDKEKPTGVGVFTLEMSMIQWALRMISATAMVDRWGIKRGNITPDEMVRIEQSIYVTLYEAPIFFDDTASLDIFQMKSKARRMVLKDGVGLIIIDYLQLMNGLRSHGENREQEVAKVSRELKQLAKELHVPIIALSQFSRKGEGADPKLSDIRESGAIEQDADDILFLIEPTADEVTKNPELIESILVKIAKHRDGSLDKIPIKFVKEIQKIMNPGEYEAYKDFYKSGGVVPPSSAVAAEVPAQPKLFIQKGSKMNTGNFDDGFDEAAPF
jgi:replicative DNA helicase